MKRRKVYKVTVEEVEDVERENPKANDSMLPFVLRSVVLLVAAVAFQVSCNGFIYAELDGNVLNTLLNAATGILSLAVFMYCSRKVIAGILDLV